jgi:hypothetical protein
MSLWIRSLAGLSFTLLSAVAIACGNGDGGDEDDGDEDGGNEDAGNDDSGDELEPGYTECGGDACTPGTYCDSYSACQTGCTSEANCTDEEACVKGEGSTVGSCVSQSSGPGGNSCERMSSFDGECEAAGLPGAAYRCMAGAPAGNCELHPDQATYPGGYCCES